MTNVIERVIAYALSKLGCRYSQSERRKEGVYDCSSLIARAFKAAGVPLVVGGSDCPTSVEEVKWIGFKLLWPASQATIGKAFGGAKERALCVPGDVVFYRTDKATTRKPPITHVALVTAPGQITHARGTKYGVVTTADDIYDGKICAICRYEPQNDVSPADKPAAQTVCVTGGSVNVRTGPGTSYGILTTVHKDDILHALEMSNGWTRVELASGKSGWVSDKYLRRT